MICIDNLRRIYYTSPCTNVLKGCFACFVGIVFLILSFAISASNRLESRILSAAFLLTGVTASIFAVLFIAKRKIIGVCLAQNELIHRDVLRTTKITLASIGKVVHDRENPMIVLEIGENGSNRHEIGIDIFENAKELAQFLEQLQVHCAQYRSGNSNTSRWQDDSR